MDMNDQLHAPTALSQGKFPPVLNGWETGWAPEPVWTPWWREKFCICQELNPGRPTSTPWLYRLSYPGWNSALAKYPSFYLVYLCFPQEATAVSVERRQRWQFNIFWHPLMKNSDTVKYKHLKGVLKLQSHVDGENLRKFQVWEKCLNITLSRKTSSGILRRVFFW
jgi:hypothetical protein